MKSTPTIPFAFSAAPSIAVALGLLACTSIALGGATDASSSTTATQSTSKTKAAAAGKKVAGPTDADADDTVFIDPDAAGPPGLAFLKAGTARVGSTVKQIQTLLDEEANKGRVRLLDAETPQTSIKIAPFYMGVYEVTNEQYHEFVKATGRRPPEHFAAEAMAAAQRAFLIEEGRKDKEARDAGEQYSPREWDKARKTAWWRENWTKVDWALPEGKGNHPVTYVDFDDARSYADWAGLRLPTEEEWIYSARGTKDTLFPWGDEWEAKGRAQTAEVSTPGTQPVGSFAEGVSPMGMYDLAGGVWEWTSSPYIGFPKFKPNTYKVPAGGKKKEERREESKFSGAKRVGKGASRDIPLLAARVSFRQGLTVTETTDALGFRVASSGTPGVDRAEAIWRTAVRPSPGRKDEATLDLGATVAIDKWTPANVADTRPAGYGVIGGYESVLFTPRGNLELRPGAELDNASRTWPVTLGALSTSVTLVEPALEPGTYLILYRAAGKFLESEEDKEEKKEKKKEKKADKKPADAEPAPAAVPQAPENLTPEQRMFASIDTKANVLIFLEAKTGEFVASVPMLNGLPKDKALSKLKTGLELEQRKVWVGENAADKVQEEHDWLLFDTTIKKGKSRAIPLHFELRVKNGTIGSGWRR